MSEELFNGLTEDDLVEIFCNAEECSPSEFFRAGVKAVARAVVEADNKWIKCSEGLPPPQTKVLVNTGWVGWVENSDPTQEDPFSSTDHACKYSTPSHWMPLPVHPACPADISSEEKA